MEKKKVYVETTVVSDATALPARDVVQLGRQLITKEWWQSGYVCPRICTPQMLMEGGFE